MKRRVFSVLAFVVPLGLVGIGVATATDRSVPGSGDHSSDKHGVKTLQWVTRELLELDTFILPDGTTFTGPQANGENGGGLRTPRGRPVPLHRGHLLHNGWHHPWGSHRQRLRHLPCPSARPGRLRPHIDIFGKGQLFGKTTLTFAEVEEQEEIVIEVAIIGGTDAFFGATGQATVREAADFEQTGLSFVTVRLVTH